MQAFGIHSFSIAAFCPLPLDKVAGAWGAWSLARKIRTAYTGPLIRVRRASDNAELDIYPTSGALDTPAIATHCGASNGFVVKVYDQTGNSKDLVQTADTTKQPQIYNGTAVFLGATGRPICLFDGSNDWLKNASSDAGYTQPATILDVIENDTWVDTRSISDGFAVNTALIFQHNSSARLAQFAGSLAINTTDDFGLDTTVLYTAKFNGASSYIRKNKLTRPTAGNPGTAPPTGKSLGARGDGSSPAAMRWSEGYSYASALSDANQDLLADDIKAWYMIV